MFKKYEQPEQRQADNKWNSLTVEWNSDLAEVSGHKEQD